MNHLPQFHESPLDDQLLASAKEHFEAGRYREAIVFAHIASELITEQVLTSWIITVQPQELWPWLFGQVDRGHNLGSAHVRKLYEALSGQDLGSAPFWGDFEAHNELRNDIMHRGVEATAEQAETSLGAIASLRELLMANLPVAAR